MTENYELFISAPFGNYIKPKGCIPVTGTYTLKPQGSPLWSVLKTLRYQGNGNWKNRLGLPNPGIEVGLKKIRPSEVLSIAEIKRGDFKKLHERIPETQSVELNLSCPNLGTSLPWEATEMFARNKEKRRWCICKVSPLVTPEDLDFLITKLGFTQIHASNTLSMPNFGGLSGPVLIPYTLNIIRMIREEWPEVTVIAGGGIKNWQNIYQYLHEGADHVSLGTVCFNPIKLRKILRERK